MDGMDWLGEGEAFDDSEFVPSPALALAQRFARSRRGAAQRQVVPVGVRPGAAIPPQTRGELARVYEMLRRLEEKQDDQTKQLALLQSRSAGLQTGDLFRLALTNAVANAGTPIANGDWWGAMAHAAPLLQNSQGASTSFAAKPLSTIVFPSGAIALHLARKPREPQIIITNPTRNAPDAGFLLTLYSPDGGTIRYTTDGSDVTRSSKEYTQPETIAAGVAGTVTVKAKAFLLVRSSDQATLGATR